MNVENFVRVCEILDRKARLTDSGPPDLPFKDPFDGASLVSLIETSSKNLPIAYRQAYAAPVAANLQSFLASNQQEIESDSSLTPQQRVQAASALVEPVVGAVFDQTIEEVRPQLRRFLAVTSDLYRSFLSRNTRAHLNIPLVEQLPPLATFAHDSGQGPFTIKCDQMKQNFGSTVGVVSLPSSYRDHPVIWATLTHETGGHDVIHADAGLIDELGRGIANLLSRTPDFAKLWTFWLDEAAADVYGLLNMGPTFIVNSAVFVSTLLHQLTRAARVQFPLGRVRTQTAAGNQGGIDEHPTDILRIFLACGVVEKLHGLSLAQRTVYLKAIETLAGACGGGAEVIQIGEQDFPLDAMGAIARQVGGFIAEAKLDSLGGHSIQDIETWDDQDEASAQAIANRFINGDGAAGLGDDAQLLSGATLALLQQPDQYDQITNQLNRGLDASFAQDPVFGKLHLHRILFEPRKALVEMSHSPPALFATVLSSDRKKSNNKLERVRRKPSRK